MRQDIQGVRNEMRSMSRDIDRRFDDLGKRLDSRFTILMTTMVAVAGVIVTILKT